MGEVMIKPAAASEIGWSALCATLHYASESPECLKWALQVAEDWSYTHRTADDRLTDESAVLPWLSKRAA
jgi:hypothetical protein